MKSIPGYEGLYSITTTGKIWWHPRQRGCAYWKGFWMNTDTKINGYKLIGLWKGGKRKYFFIHKLLAICFIPNPNNFPIINHKNSKRDDNRISNLEWCTYQMNIQHGVNKGHYWRQHSAKHMENMRRKKFGLPLLAL